MGSQLTKNYDIDKEPYMTGGLHNLWKVYRGKKKDRNNMDVSIFIFEKKTLEKRKLTQAQKDDICNIMKKDPTTLAKVRHPNMLQLIEQPLEDNKIIVFVTEPVEFNLASLVLDAGKKEYIPGDLEIKCLTLELLEALNFLHQNAKMIHMNLAPEHIYVTREGRLRLAGLNFPQQFSTAETLNVPLQYDLKIGEYSMVPNFQFSAPEISDRNQVSVQSDLFSVGCLIYFMCALNKSKLPFLLNLKDITDKSSHQFELNCLEKRFPMLMAGFDNELEQIVKQLTNISNPQMRGSLQTIVEKNWFQDPLLKTIKFLENIDQKEHQNKVQFLNGITRILEKFDKKALIKKVIPLLLDSMKVVQLSVNVLPSILICMEKPNFITTTEFREVMWPSISKLCKAKELPAQSLFLILKNTELFLKFVGPQEFQTNFLPLLLKSLECGVAKLQFLALTKVPQIYKTLDYQIVKASLLPRMLQILEKTTTMQLKCKVLETVYEIISSIDQNTMKDIIIKSFEKVRATESDPQVCMLMLKIYEEMAKVLGVEEIGLKILPGMIPMLIQGTFSKQQFKELIGSVRRLLDQIEIHRDKDLNDLVSDTNKPSEENKGMFDFDQIEKSLGMKNETPLQNPTNQDVFDFLNSIGTSSTPTSAPQSAQASSNPFGSMSVQNPQDIFSVLGSGSSSSQQTIQPTRMSDPFASISQNANSGLPPPPSNMNKQQPTSTFSSGWDNDIPNILDIKDNKPSQQKPQQQIKPLNNNSDDFFSNLANSNNNLSKNNVQEQISFGGSISKGVFNKNNDDPFAELVEGSSTQSKQPNYLPSNLNIQQPVFNQGVAGYQANLNLPGFNQQQHKSVNQMGSATFSTNSSMNTNPIISNNFGNNNLVGINFGNQSQNSLPGLNANPFGGLGAQPIQNNALSNADDFFSQFTSSSNQQQQKQNQGNNFNIFQ